MTEARESNELKPAEPVAGDEDAALDAVAIAALLAAGDSGGGDEPRPTEPAPGGEAPELDAARIAALVAAGDPGDGEAGPAGPAPEGEDAELDAAAIAALLRGGDPGDDEPGPAGSAPEGEDAELDAAAIAALLGGGDPGDDEPGTVARAAEPTPVASAAEPADEFFDVLLTDVLLTPLKESEEAPPAEAADTQEPVPEVVAPEPARGPSWFGRAVCGLRERWAEEVPARVARVAARLREGAARVRCALARSAEKEAPAPEAAAAAGPAPVEEPAPCEPVPAEEPAPAREPEALAGEGSEAQPWVAKLVLVSLCVNTVAMAALLAVLFLRPHDPGLARADGRSRDHAAARALARAKRGALPGPTLKLGDFFVLLRDDAGGPEGGRERYARISVDLELPDETAKQAASLRLPPFRDAVLSCLSDRTAEEFRGSEALGRLKAVLARRLSEAAPSIPVRAIYFSDLVVQ